MSASPSKPSPVPPVQYKGGDLEADRGPGLGCFRFQLVVLLVLIVLTPISVLEDWPPEASAALLLITIVLLLFAGQTIIFLLRLVAADRAAGRRRPMASRTRTVGEIEEAESNVAGGDDGSPDDEKRSPGGPGEPAGNLPHATDHSSTTDSSAGPLPNPPDVRQ